MQFVIRKYHSGYCTYEIEADDEEQAYKMMKGMPIGYDEVLETLEPWEDCDEVEPVTSN